MTSDMLRSCILLVGVADSPCWAWFPSAGLSGLAVSPERAPVKAGALFYRRTAFLARSRGSRAERMS